MDCPNCGKKIDLGSRFCPACGRAQEQSSSPGSDQLTKPAPTLPTSAKSGLACFLLCLFLGQLGIHRFYVGKIGTGILMLLTGGGLGFWYLYDLISIVCNNFTDKKGHVVEISKNPTAAKTVVMVVAALFLGLIVIISTFIVLIVFLLSSLVDVALEQLAAIRAGDYEKAYTYTSAAFKESVPLSAFKQFIDQNPQIKNSISASFTNREMNNGNGILIGTLKEADGSKIAITYHLVKENNQWKILSIKIKPDESGLRTEKTSVTQETTKAQSASTKIYENKSANYSILYPDNWQYNMANDNTILFSGQKGAPDSDSTVKIQVIATNQNGGNYQTVNDVIDALKSQASIGVSELSFSKVKDIDLKERKNRQALHGKFFMMTYKRENQEFIQMQFVFIRDDQKLFYAIAYTAPKANFKRDLPIVQAILSSWSVF